MIIPLTIYILLIQNVITNVLNQILSRISGTTDTIVFIVKSVIDSNTNIIFTGFTVNNINSINAICMVYNT